VSITDGPYAETKEQLGGFGVFETRDLNHAIQLMSKHPGVKAGPVEIRPAENPTEPRFYQGRVSPILRIQARPASMPRRRVSASMRCGGSSNGSSARSNVPQ
jgi:YCII-related domain